MVVGKQPGDLRHGKERSADKLYYGTKQVIEACLPLLKASSDGRIVNVSSHFGQLRVRSSNHYGSEYEIV